jgi:hypothetical protein
MSHGCTIVVALVKDHRIRRDQLLALDPIYEESGRARVVEFRDFPSS